MKACVTISASGYPANIIDVNVCEDVVWLTHQNITKAMGKNY